MPFKVSIFWTQQTSQLVGWSENFWNTLTNSEEVRLRGRALAVTTNTFKANPVYPPYYRVGNADNFRDAETFRTLIQPQTITPATDADYPTTKGLLKMTSAQNRKTNQWIGGLRDRDVTTSGNWTPAPASVTAFNAVVALLTTPANGWALRILRQGVGNEKRVIVSINGTTGVMIVSGPGPVFPDNSRVRVSRVRGMTVANGIWRVTQIDTVTYQLHGWQATTLPFLKGNPTAQLQVYDYQSIATANIVRTSSHRVGRPTGQPSGRRKKKAS